MTLVKCRSCGQEKPPEAFRYDARLRTKRDKTCTACRSDRRRKQRHERRRQAAAEEDDRVKPTDEHARMIRDYLQRTGCQRCGHRDEVRPAAFRPCKRGHYDRGEIEVINIYGHTDSSLMAALRWSIVLCGNCIFALSPDDITRTLQRIDFERIAAEEDGGPQTGRVVR